MKLLDFQAEAYIDDFKKKGYVRIHQGVSPAFIASAQAKLASLLDTNRELKEWEYKNKKNQYLFDLEGAGCDLTAIKHAIATLSGHAVEDMRLSERHIKFYSPDAPAQPTPHKDRFQAAFNVGIPLRVPGDSHLVLYPDDYVDVNPFSSAAAYRESLDLHQLPEHLLKHIEPVRIYDKPGDLLLFRGSSIYHERINAAGVIVLYLKFNAQGLDPLAEDPLTVQQLKCSAELLAGISDSVMMKARVGVSPLLDKVSRHYTRHAWKEVLQAELWGAPAFCINETEFNILKRSDGRSTVAEMIQALLQPGQHQADLLPHFRRLGRLRGITLSGPGLERSTVLSDQKNALPAEHCLPTT